MDKRAHEEIPDVLVVPKARTYCGFRLFNTRSFRVNSSSLSQLGRFRDCFTCMPNGRAIVRTWSFELPSRQLFVEMKPKVLHVPSGLTFCAASLLSTVPRQVDDQRCRGSRRAPKHTEHEVAEENRR